MEKLGGYDSVSKGFFINNDHSPLKALQASECKTSCKSGAVTCDTLEDA